MSFVDLIGGDGKQRINLSKFALNIINEDMIAFNNNHFTTFINTIIANYKNDSEATISIVLDRERKKLEETLKNIDKPHRDEVISKLLIAKKKELIAKAFSHENYKSCPVRLRKENLLYLTDPDSECCEEKYYNYKPGKYLKALIEDYASRAFCERELIYFADRVKLIETAISERRKLSVKTANGKHYIIYPCRILRDPMSMYNYLIGFSCDSEEKSKHPVSLRLSGNISISLRNSAFFVKSNEIKALEDHIRNRGVQFLLGEETEIVVALTENGKQKFSSQLHLRPNCIEIRNGNEFVFRCTPTQAEYYFVKFGKDAFIKEPESLQKVFRNIYYEAYCSYSD